MQRSVRSLLPAAALMLALANLCSSQSLPAGSAIKSTNIPPPPAKTLAAAMKKAKKKEVRMKPFSQLALGGGFGLMGGNLQAATNVNRHMNLRTTGNVFNYSVNNITTNGFNLSGTANFATAGASLDYYPFPTHGFRLSPGVLFSNQNQISATATVAGGQSITLNGIQYYSATTNGATGASPIDATANLGLHSTKQAFTITTGWSNMIPRKGGHWSYPVEIGAAFTGTPTLNMNLTGWACADEAETECVNLAGSSALATQVQSNLTAQIAKWKSDLDLLKAYPIVSFGVSYNFHLRNRGN